MSTCAVAFARTYRLFILKPVKLFHSGSKANSTTREGNCRDKLLIYDSVFFFYTLIYNSRFGLS